MPAARISSVQVCRAGAAPRARFQRAVDVRRPGRRDNAASATSSAWSCGSTAARPADRASCPGPAPTTTAPTEYAGRARRAAPGQLDRLGEQGGSRASGHGSEPIAQHRRVAHGADPQQPRAAVRAGRAEEAGERGSPSSTGATASRSSSASPAASTAVSTAAPPSTSSRPTPRSASSANTPARSPPSTTAPARLRTPPRPGRARRRGRARPAPGDGGMPAAHPGRPPGRGADQQPRVVGADRAGADEDRVAAGPQLVYRVKILRAGQDQPARRPVVERAVHGDRRAQQHVRSVRHAITVRDQSDARRPGGARSRPARRGTAESGSGRPGGPR